MPDINSMPTDTMWTMFLGVFAPLLVAVINQWHWPGWLKVLVTGIVCTLLAVGQLFYTGHLDGHDLPRTALVLALTAVAAYHWVWRPSGLAPSIEIATSASR